MPHPARVAGCGPPQTVRLPLPCPALVNRKVTNRRGRATPATDGGRTPGGTAACDPPQTTEDRDLRRRRSRHPQLPHADRRTGPGPELPGGRLVFPRRPARRGPERQRPAFRARHPPRGQCIEGLRREAPRRPGPKRPRRRHRGLPPRRQRPGVPRPRRVRNRAGAGADHAGRGGAADAGRLHAAPGPGVPSGAAVRHRRRIDRGELDRPRTPRRPGAHPRYGLAAPRRRFLRRAFRRRRRRPRRFRRDGGHRPWPPGALRCRSRHRPRRRRRRGAADRHIKDGDHPRRRLSWASAVRPDPRRRPRHEFRRRRPGQRPARRHRLAAARRQPVHRPAARRPRRRRLRHPRRRLPALAGGPADGRRPRHPRGPADGHDRWRRRAAARWRGLAWRKGAGATTRPASGGRRCG